MLYHVWSHTLIRKKVSGITIRNQFFSANLMQGWQRKSCVMGKKLPTMKFYLNTKQKGNLL